MTKKTTTDKNNNVKPSTMSRKQIFRRALTYSLMTVATIAGVAVCIAWAMGYRFNLESGEISQVALLQFNTYPRGAMVQVGEATLAARTPTRANIKTGKTTIQMSLNGYHTWSKTVSALPSTVRWLDYVRFVPTEIKTQSVHTFSDVDDIEQSPDRKWALVIEHEDTPTVDLVDLHDPQKIDATEIKLAGEQITAGENNRYEITEWDSGSRFVLIKHSYDDTSEYLRLDRKDKTTVNLSRDFGVILSEPHFSGNSGNIFYAITGTDLRRLDYGAKSISTPLATNVTDYVLYGNNRLAYVTKVEADGKTTQTVSIYDDDTATKIKQYDDDKQIRIGFKRNNDTDYLTVARDETVAVYPDPLKKNADDSHKNTATDTAYLSSPGGIDWLQVSDNGRFVLAGHDHKVVCYDVETGENYSYELERTGRPVWLDDYHLMDVRSDTLTMIEFDGQNAQCIVKGNLPAFLSSNQEYMFSLDDVSGGVVLQRSNMTVND